jgi:hypothetical protein
MYTIQVENVDKLSANVPIGYGWNDDVLLDVLSQPLYNAGGGSNLKTRKTSWADVGNFLRFRNVGGASATTIGGGGNTAVRLFIHNKTF